MPLNAPSAAADKNGRAILERDDDYIYLSEHPAEQSKASRLTQEWCQHGKGCDLTLGGSQHALLLFGLVDGGLPAGRTKERSRTTGRRVGQLPRWSRTTWTEASRWPMPFGRRVGDD